MTDPSIPRPRIRPREERFVGTSGYNYKEWKGVFYPEKTASKDVLGYYASQLNTVEINNTFYRVPKPHVVESWVEQVPDGFRFVAKATRRITHIKRLKEAAEETEYFLGIAAHFEATLGAILFQLPPFLRGDVDRLRAFVDTLPDGTRGAFEFRHDSWYVDEVFDTLRERNLALCFAHDEEDTDKDVARRFVSTADWGKLRLRAKGYSDEELKGWSPSVDEQGWKESYIFFNHEDDGAGPALAARFNALAE